MKSSSLSLLITLACSATTVQAAECSVSEIDISTKLKSDPSIPSSCGIIGSTAPTSTLASVNPCSAECIAYLEKFTSQLPSCELRGIPLRAPFDTAIQACKASGGLSGEAVVPTSTTAAPTSSANATSSNETQATPTVTTGKPVTATPVPSQTSLAVTATAASSLLLACVVVLWMV